MKKVLIISVLVFMLLQSCAEDKKESKRKVIDSVETENLAEQMSWDVEVHFIDSSYTKAILKANRSRMYQDRQETLLDGDVVVEYMSRSSGKRISLLTADSARIDDTSKDMIAWGNVVVVSDSSKTTLTTEVLQWANKTRKFYSTEYVEFRSPMEDLNGYGFESDQNLKNYKVFQVSGEKK
jgi:lipopolysaccharide export system protein LptC